MQLRACPNDLTVVSAWELLEETSSCKSPSVFCCALLLLPIVARSPSPGAITLPSLLKSNSSEVTFALAQTVAIFVIYVTQQVEFLPSADLILVLKDGRITQSGKYNAILNSGSDFMELVGAHRKALSALDSTISGPVSKDLTISKYSDELQQRYIPSARKLAQLVRVSKAPVIQHFAKTISVSATIRSFDQESRFTGSSMKLTDGAFSANVLQCWCNGVTMLPLG
ncbi:multidrug resistance-associated protein 3 [Actinidia rufa]|uniref:Multidrug resistance-associated protein 3 n=1 Tax=Actinidia rufa TaxID=165716 RepID=A0A7J0G463_9ERIC|nr:multidrug resistance-associated protein 3 [Actinidia rufa]